jgi:D-glycero-D-manno-heptose 1,7-bisphosphate phosphatase
MKLVILDRDGVINHDSDAYIKSEDEWNPIEGSLEAIARLSQAGFRIVVATNQSGVARGLFDLASLARMHTKMHDLVAQAGGHIDAVFFCPHLESDACECRKPKPGMVRDALRRLRIEAEDTIVVGDKISDLQAGHAVGCHVALVRTGKGAKTEVQAKDQLQSFNALVFADLEEASRWISTRMVA